MTEEEYFIKNYPDVCYGDKPLSPYWDYFQDGVEFGERESDKKIADLEKENAELKEKYLYVVNRSPCLAELEENITKAKEIIKKLYPFVRDKCYTTTLSENKERQSLITEAEQFLSEVEK